MSSIIWQANADWFVFHKQGFQYDVYKYLITHPGISQWFYRLAAVIDLACIAGFFTKRFDQWLLAGLVAFHVGNLFLLHISFVEQSLIFAPFLPWQKWANHFQINNSDDRSLAI
jgi:hypothetical protein